MAEAVAADQVLQRSLHSQRVFLDRLNPLESLKSDTDVKARYRFFRGTIYTIMGLILPAIQRPTRKSSALPPLLMLCCALRFFATGSFYMVLGDCLNISAASMCRAVHTVAISLVELAPQYIKFPSEDALDAVKGAFFAIAGRYQCRTSVLPPQKR